MHIPADIPFFSTGMRLHLLFEELGMVLGFRYYLYLRKNSTDAITNYQRIWILCGAGLGALLLSRLLGALEDPFAFFSPHTPWLYYYTNKTIIGGLLGGLLGTEVTKKIMHVHTSSGDLFALPIILAIAIGRIGCSLAGLEDGTYGSPTALPWGVDYGDGIRRHPAAVYEIIFLMLLGAALMVLKRNYSFKNGYFFKWFMVPYLIFRLFIEFMKPDYRFPFGLSILQMACMAGLIYYYKVFITSPFIKPLQTAEP